MVTKLTPEINKVYFINQYTLVHILSGTGGIQVDFKNYYDWQDKAIYLSKGQYIKFLSDDFVVRMIDFSDDILFHSEDVRVLFKHLIALGYINFKECETCERYLTQSLFNDQTHSIIDVSTQQWYWQNPFNANKDEYQLIFDTKEVIDAEFKNNLTNQDLATLISDNGMEAMALVKDKLGLTVKSMIRSKKVLESKKEIAFTDKSIKEVSYDMGFKDPAYFDRVFKSQVGQHPTEFRTNFAYEERDRFSQDLIDLIKIYHHEERQLGFYAEKMHLSVKGLSKKVKDKLQTTVGQLIRNELLFSAKNMLDQEASVNDVAYALGFEEAQHFSSFFKHYTGNTPSQYRFQKYKS